MKTRTRFYSGIVLPALLAIVLFVLVIRFIFIPSLERNIMERKKEMIRELTYTAHSLVNDYYQEYCSGNMEENRARQEAAGKLRRMRYGKEDKDYFWITDSRPVMIMHPYLPQLNGRDMSEYTDPEGTAIFYEAAQIVEERGEGYLEYRWQWKDDSTRVVPKLSFVTEFAPWEWIIGTGIYLEDAAGEIRAIKGRLLRISGLILLLTSGLMFIVMRQSHRIERERSAAESRLKLSRQKYKSLVEASTEGTLMISDGQIIFSNYRFADLAGYSPDEVLQTTFDKLFVTGWNDLLDTFEQPGRSVSRETSLKTRKGGTLDVVLTASKVKLDEKETYILIVRELSFREEYEKSSVQFSEEITLALGMMSQPVESYVRKLHVCPINTPVGKALDMLQGIEAGTLYVTYEEQLLGYVDAGTVLERSVRGQVNKNDKVSVLMKSPVHNLPGDSLLFEALEHFRIHEVSSLIITDARGEPSGILEKEYLLEHQHNYFQVLLKDIGQIRNTSQLKQVFTGMLAGIHALQQSGLRSRYLSRALSTVADAITTRVLELMIDETGKPPCRFSFLVLGSEGRMEQSLKTDQDNALVFEDGSEEEVKHRKEYFLKLSKKVNRALDEIGYKLCDGDIMAGNPEWNQPMSQWKEYFRKWIGESDPQAILNSSVFFDLRHLYGNINLAGELQEFILSETKHKAVYFLHMARAIQKTKLPLGLFGGIVGEQSDSGKEEVVDLKRLILPLVSFARLYTLRAGRKEQNTLRRLELLKQEQLLPGKLLHELEETFEKLMQKRYLVQTEAWLRKESYTNKLRLDTLDSIESTTFKRMLSILQDMNTQLGFDFRI